MRAELLILPIRNSTRVTTRLKRASQRRQRPTFGIGACLQHGPFGRFAKLASFAKLA